LHVATLSVVAVDANRREKEANKREQQIIQKQIEETKRIDEEEARKRWQNATQYQSDLAVSTSKFLLISWVVRCN
jgi:hypothetical protein